MNLNDIFSYGGSANVVIRFPEIYSLNGITYTENEPYTILKNVNINFGYDNKDTNTKNRGNLISYREIYPNTVELYNVTLTKKLSDLLFPVLANAGTKGYFESKKVMENGIIYLNHSNCSDFFIYDEDGTLISDFTYNSNNDTLSSALFVEDETFLIFYEYQVNNQFYSLQSSSLPYLTLEIFGVGNKNEENSSIYLYLENCSLLTDNNLNLTQSGSTNISLTFSIIENENNFMVLD